MRYKSLLLFSITLSFSGFSQVLLNADGNTNNNTYELITSVLAPGYNPVEVPDCNHAAFGRHIDELYDTDLGIDVFRFHIHVSPDNDRCINTDRQRNEIKSYDQSPDNLLGISGEIVEYKWKFKLDANFQVSPNFTHLHQLKSVGGPLESMPMYTLTARKSSPQDQLELRYAETDSQITLQKTDLAPFKGAWLEVIETITYGISGTYSLIIKKVSDQSILFDYSNDAIINWRENAAFVRPKWGIYRSLINAQDLKDETVLFANFSIEERRTLSIHTSKKNTNLIRITTNPVKDFIIFKAASPNSFDTVCIYDVYGKLVLEEKQLTTNKLNVSKLSQGLYVMLYKQNGTIVSQHKIAVN